MNFQMFKLVLEKAEELEIKFPSVGLSKKKESSRKTSISALLTMENSERYGNTRPLDLPLEKSVPRPGSNSWLELDVEQQTDSKLGKQYVKAVYCHPAYLTYM